MYEIKRVNSTCTVRPVLTLKAPITSAADDIHIYFFHCFSEKIRLDVSSESSARLRIHMKIQGLFSSKGKGKKLKCHLLQFLFGRLRVKWSLKANPKPECFRFDSLMLINTCVITESEVFHGWARLQRYIGWSKSTIYPLLVVDFVKEDTKKKTRLSVITFHSSTESIKVFMKSWRHSYLTLIM